MPTIDKIIIRLLVERHLPSKELYKYAKSKSSARSYIKHIIERKELSVKRNEKGYYLAGSWDITDADYYIQKRYGKRPEKLHWKTYPEWWKRLLFSL